MLSPEHLADALVVVVVAAKSLLDVRGGRRRDTSHATGFGAISTKIDSLRDDIEDVRGDVREVRAFVVGPDGENGLRGDVREIKKRVIGLEDRERGRLEARDVGSYQPPRSS